ncbi:MAG TPA: oligosaccharide flippase family protein [Anaerolineales bacterium]|nr:oligosaccharide flippase family protein [Anaerolineales bacterium]
MMLAPPKGNSKSSQLAANVIKLVGGTTVAQILTILTAPLISRLYKPSAVGTTGLFVSMIVILNVIVCLRYEQAIMLPKEDSEGANLYIVSLLIALMMSGLTLVIVLIGKNLIPSFLNAPEIAPYLWLIPIAVLIQGIFLATNLWNSRSKLFGRLSIARVAASFSTSVFPILLAFMGYANATGLIVSYMLGTTIFTLVLFGQVILESWPIFRQEITTTRIKTAVKRYRKFPLFDAWGALVNTLSWQLPTIMLSIFFSQMDVGHYSMANRVLLLPMTLIGNAIAQVFFQQASETYASTGSITKPVEMVFQRLVAISLPLAILLTLFGPRIFFIVLGAQWEIAGVYAQILAPWMFFLFIASPISSVFSILEKQEQALFVHITILITRAISLLIGGMLGDIKIALILWTASGIIVYGALAVWNMNIASVQWVFITRVMGRYLTIGFGYGLVLYLLEKWLQINSWSTLMIAAGLTAIYYLWVLRSDAGLYGYLNEIIRRRIVK